MNSNVRYMSVLALNVRFGHALAQKLQALLRQVDHLALVLLSVFGLGFDISARNSTDVLDNVLGLANEPNQGLVLRLEKLQQGPHGNVLERRVSGLQESAEISVHAAVGFLPVLYKDAVIAHYKSQSISRRNSGTYLWKTSCREPRRCSLGPQC